MIAYLRIWSCIFAFGLLTRCATPSHAAAASPYPPGSTTRLYEADVKGSIAGIPQSGKAEAELTIIDETNSVTHARVRGRFTDAPTLAGAIENEWSNYVDVWATGWPFRAEARWADGKGTIAAQPAADWSTIVLEAQGQVIGIDATIGSTTAKLVDTRTNAPGTPATSTNAIGSVTNATSDAIDLAKGWQRYGQHKVNLPAMDVTRTLYSAKNLGENVRLSFEPLGWPTKHDPKKGKTTDGGVVILWEEGSGYAGGFFDHHGVGQTTKTQDNIAGGYLEGHQPPKGAKVWYCIVAYSFAQRTSIAYGGTW